MKKKIILKVRDAHILYRGLSHFNDAYDLIQEIEANIYPDEIQGKILPAIAFDEFMDIKHGYEFSEADIRIAYAAWHYQMTQTALLPLHTICKAGMEGDWRLNLGHEDEHDLLVDFRGYITSVPRSLEQTMRRFYFFLKQTADRGDYAQTDL